MKGKKARWDRWKGTWLRHVPITSDSPATSSVIPLSDLTAGKAKLRAKLASCKAAQSECLFELDFSCLSSRDLKPISSSSMKKLVANTIALICACESKYALVADEANTSQDDGRSTEEQTSGTSNESDKGFSRPVTPGGSSTEEHGHQGPTVNEKRTRKDKSQLDLIKPRREIEFGDAHLLNFLITKIIDPLRTLQRSLDRSVEIISVSIAFAYVCHTQYPSLRPFTLEGARSYPPSLVILCRGHWVGCPLSESQS
jgi:hypothetical protein